jgi:hypothetical protein
MAKEQLKHTDISEMPELLRLAEEVLRTQQGQVLVKDGEELVTVSPRKRVGKQIPVLADPPNIWASYDPKKVRQALRRSAGLLAGVDVEQLLHELSEQREQDSEGRPA